MSKLIIAWIIVISVFVLLTRDEGIYYYEPSYESCQSDYMGGCN